VLEEFGMTIEILEFWILVAVLVAGLVLAVVAIRRDTDARWRRVARFAAIVVVLDFVLLVAWLRLVAWAGPF
jgi:hypothetical protein